MKELGLGVTGRQVARNIRWYREISELSYSALASRLENLGHRIPVLGLRRIEANARRVDVDDLMALAVALETSLIDLLFRSSVEAEGEGTGTGLPQEVNDHEAKAWARGETGLSARQRERYWTARASSLEQELQWRSDRAVGAEEEAAAKPDDDILRRIAVIASQDVGAVNRDLEEAEKRLELLQMTLEGR